MSEIICINGKFDSEQLAFWEAYGVEHPETDSMYNISSKKHHTTGDVGVILYEIRNPKVPIKHPILGIVMMDVTFNLNRFRHLNGDLITEKELENVDLVKL